MTIQPKAVKALLPAQLEGPLWRNGEIADFEIEDRAMLIAADGGNPGSIWRERHTTRARKNPRESERLARKLSGGQVARPFRVHLVISPIERWLARCDGKGNPIAPNRQEEVVPFWNGVDLDSGQVPAASGRYWWRANLLI